MSDCRSAVACRSDFNVDRSRSRGWPLHVIARVSRAAAAAMGLGFGALIALSVPADAGLPSPSPPTFCNNSESGCIAGAGPITDPGQGLSGSQRLIQQRLEQLRSEGTDHPTSANVGGAAADSVSYEGLGIFVSGLYEHKDKEVTDTELGFTSDSA